LESSAETAQNSENHEENPRKRKKRAVFEDFVEIVPNVIGEAVSIMVAQLKIKQNCPRMY
jgi:hypothetical protein